MSSPGNKPPIAPDTLTDYAEGDEIVQRASVVIRRSLVRAQLGEPIKTAAQFARPFFIHKTNKKKRCAAHFFLVLSVPRRFQAVVIRES